MTGEWKVLRGNPGKRLENEPEEEPLDPGKERGLILDADVPGRSVPPPAEEGREGESSDRYGERADSARPGPGSGRDAVEYTAGPRGVVEEPVPTKHVAMALCLLAVVFFGWLFRDEVRGVASWAVSVIQGKDVPLTAKAPGLAGISRFNEPYDWDEFVKVCVQSKGETIIRILDKQPAFMRSPDGTPLLHILAMKGAPPDVLEAVGGRTDDDSLAFRDGEGRTLLHLAASGRVGSSVLRAFRGKETETLANARDGDGQTPLHLAAGSAVSPGLVLALRGMGADPSLRDNAGRFPLEYLLLTWGGMPEAVTSAERKKFSEFGYTVSVPFTQERDGKRQTRFVSIADQVSDLEGKRYFTLCAEAHLEARESGFPASVVADGDQVGHPDKEMENFRLYIMSAKDRMREHNRPKGEPLWKSVSLRKWTGAAMAKFKALLPEAYPETVNFFSALLVGEHNVPPFDAEWNAWDVPTAVRFALAMRMVQERGRQRKNRSPNTVTLGDDDDAFLRHAMAEYRERGDVPQARNPVLMVWTLLDYDEPPATDISASQNLSPHAPAGQNVKTGNGKRTGELDNLRALHGRLPTEAWKAVGRHLVAAAYVAEKRRDGLWAAGMMPSKVKNAGGLDALRLWGNEDRED
ncbi:MAG: hypothetical protein LIP28_03525, partial [Deltaproteobacteria bacterium]|nr:hypothetical protein [Deltaproteobacteria bacterium]